MIPTPPAPHSDRAIVLGASLTGLLTATALAAHCREVLVVDRDPLDGDLDAPRKGVPQGKHAHGLLVGGLQAMETLLPGLTAELVERGALPSDIIRDSVWVMRGEPVARFESGLVGLLGTRTLLESQVRRRVRAMAGVMLLGGHDVVRLTASADRRRVTGAVLAPRDGGDPITLTAEVVVDATGKGSRAPVWLTDLGYPVPPVSEVEAGITYVTRTFRDVPGLLPGTDAVIVGANPPGLVGGVALRQENDQWILTLTGIHGIQPPTELAEFIRFAAALPTTALAHVASAAQPIGEPAVFRYPASRWRHYEKHSRRPEGFLVIGDAVCSFNPVYGQGMSSAGRQVLALADLLARVSDPDGLARAAAKAADVLAEVVATPWSLATGADRRFPGMPAKPLPERVVDRYMDRLVKVARHDPRVTHAFMRVLNLLEPPSTLLAPAMAARVLRPGATRAPRPVADPVPAAAHAAVRTAL
ncbi:MAG: FAD-dependent oxidoreductase [Dermatophilaceae bacterium]